jgi:uncharacterized protein with NAD-binding domain and iron-sulfur cluster
MQKTRIAVLGGGMGALSAAFQLTATEALRASYEVTVYTEGWTLGGKCSSGRNATAFQRNEEHGLHMLMGFYDNVFRLMRQCYEELGRSPDQPLPTWEKAVQRRPMSFLADWDGKNWLPWCTALPMNDKVPGYPEGEPSPVVAAGMDLWRACQELLRLMEEAFLKSPVVSSGPSAPPASAPSLPAWLRELFPEGAAPLEAAPHPHQYLTLARKFATQLPSDASQHRAIEHDVLQWLLDMALHWLRNFCSTMETAVRRLLILLDLGKAIITGILREGLLVKPLSTIDDVDLMEWLRRNGAQHADSAPIRAFYQGAFAFRNGEPDSPALSAAVGLHALKCLCLDYKGAMMWEMLAGMGETIFAPLFQVLSARGVKVHFFHQVNRLELSSPDKTHIERIHIFRQVELAGDTYSPLVDVQGLPCWPSEPLYAQIRAPANLKELKPRLHRRWPAEPVGETVLQRGQDFDLVVLGIPSSALEPLTEELSAASPAWKDMLSHLESVHTFGVQVWLEPTLEGLGWKGPPPVLGGYIDPLSTWGDMAQLLSREDWPEDLKPNDLAYFCAVRPPPQQDDVPQDEVLLRMRALTQTWFEQNTGAFWPEATLPQAPNTLNWELLIVPNGMALLGPERLQWHYFAASQAPSDRYILSVPGSTRYRLNPGGSGFANLYLAGDWVNTALNAGGLEATVMGGLGAARAICGEPKVIYGEPLD